MVEMKEQEHPQTSGRVQRQPAHLEERCSPCMNSATWRVWLRWGDHISVL
jgi:hypothetical protein